PYEETRTTGNTLPTGTVLNARGAGLSITVSGSAADDMGLSANGGGSFRASSDSSLFGEPEDFMVLDPATGQSLLPPGGGRIEIDGNRLLIELDNQAGGLETPTLVFADDFDQTLIEDAAGSDLTVGNSPGSFFSNLPNVINNADASGLLRLRDSDGNPHDGVLSDVPPGLVEIDLSRSLLGLGQVIGITVTANTANAPVPGNFPGDANAAGLSPHFYVSNGGLELTEVSLPLDLGANPAQARFFLSALTGGDYRFHVTATLASAPVGVATSLDANGDPQLQRDFRVAVRDEAPVAILPRGPIVFERPNSGTGTLTVDGSRSADPNGLHVAVPNPVAGTTGLQYHWRLVTDPDLLTPAPAGLTFTDSGSDSIGFGAGNPTESITVASSLTPGVYYVVLTVRDGPTGLDSAPAVLPLVVQGDPNSGDRVPTAHAGFDQVVRRGERVTLDGSRSVDPDGTPLTYTWSQVKNNSSSDVTLSLADPAHPSFTAPDTDSGEVLTFALTVEDAAGRVSYPDEVHITVIDNAPGSEEIPPYAAASVVVPGGGFATVGQRLLVDASASQAVPRVADYRYRLSGGLPVDLSRSPGGDTAAVFAPFTGTIRLSIQCANLQGGLGAPSELEIPVIDASLAQPPEAKITATPAGPAYAVNTAITLDGSTSVDTDGSSPGNLRFTWRQIEGPLVGLIDPSASSAQLSPTEPGVYTIELTVVDPDSSVSASSRFSFVVTSGAAVTALASANPANPVVGDSVTIDASASSDSASPPSPLHFRVEQLAGLPVLLSNRNLASDPQAIFTALTEGDYRFRVHVETSDGRAALPADVSFTVSSAPTAPPASSPETGGSKGGGGGGCALVGAGRPMADRFGTLFAPALLLLGLLWVRSRRRRRVQTATEDTGRAGSSPTDRRSPLLRRSLATALLAGLSLNAAGCAAGVWTALVLAFSGGGGGGGVDLTQPDLVLSAASAPTVGTIVQTPTATAQTTGPNVVALDKAVRFAGDGTLRCNVFNTGNDLAAADFDVAWFLVPVSGTKDLSGQAFRVRTHTVAAASQPLEIGAALRLADTPSGPDDLQRVEASNPGDDLTPGLYYLIALANSGDTPILELAIDNNTVLGSTLVQLYDESTTTVDLATNPDVIATDFEAPTALLVGARERARLTLRNAGGAATVTGTANFRLYAGPSLIETGSFPIAALPAGATATALIDFDATLAELTTPAGTTFINGERRRLRIEFDILDGSSVDQDGVANNNERLATATTDFYDTNLIFDNGANLPKVNDADPTVLDITTQRPATTTSLAPGEQRILAFEIPDTGVEPVVSQAVITVDSRAFDPVVELLNPAGGSMALRDDTTGSTGPSIYTELRGSRANRFFFVVVSARTLTGGGSFTIRVNLNPFTPSDDAPPNGFEITDLLGDLPEGTVVGGVDVNGVRTNTETIVLPPIDFSGSLEQEIFFEIPAPGRFPLRLEAAGLNQTTDDLFLDPDRTSLVRFDRNGDPTDLALVIERDANGGLLLLSPESDGRLDLPAGRYTLILHAQFLPEPVDKPFQLVVGPAILFDRTVTESSLTP
ncbi:MAG: hypothetical protein D6776_00640, partial [Planctomycetota bacterium]